MRKNLSSFLRRSYLMVGLFGWPEEKNALIDNPLARATTPDDIIEAACINSIARDFDAWKKSCILDGHQAYLKRYANCKDPMILAGMGSSHIYSTMCLQNQDKNIVLRYEENACKDSRKNYTVNGVVFPDKKGYAIICAWDKIRDERARAKAKADAALAEMKRLEGAWDLAENLLGLKRNEFGALVPVEDLDGCGSGPCVGKRADKMCYCGNCKGKKRAR